MSAELTLDRGADRIANLYSHHAPGAGRLAFLLTGDRDLAEDLAQEAFVRTIGRIGSIRSPESFAAYLRRAVVNLTGKHWRRAATERRFLARHTGTTGVEQPPDIAAKDELWRALLKLPHEQRAALVLRFFEDLSEREAAAALRCPTGTLKSRVARGLQALRIEMRGEFDAER